MVATAEIVFPSWVVFGIVAAVCVIIYKDVSWLYLAAKCYIVSFMHKWSQINRVGERSPHRRDRSRSPRSSSSPRRRRRDEMDDDADSSSLSE